MSLTTLTRSALSRRTHHRILASPRTGSIAALRVGDTLEVRLPQDSATGYVWTVSHAPAVVQGGDESVHSAAVRPAGSMTRAPGIAITRSLRFRAVAEGSGSLRFSLEHEEDDEVKASFDVAVKVRPAHAAARFETTPTTTVSGRGRRGTGALDERGRGAHRVLAMRHRAIEVVEEDPRTESALLEGVLGHRGQAERV